MTTSRYPQFPADYRERNVSNGLWLDRTLHDYFAESVEAAPDHVAIVEGERRITFAAWNDEVERLSAGLTRLGIQKGDVVTVQLPNWAEMCVIQIALSRIGAVIQPMHMVYREQEIESMLRFCDSRAIICPERYHKFGYAAAVQEMRGRLPDLDFILTVRGVGGDHTYEDLTQSKDGLAEYEAANPVSADDVFYLNFTSGTTGTPKGFLHTHNSLVSVLKRFTDMQGQFDKKMHEDVALANSPMSHSFGHLSTYHVILRRSRMVMVERFDPGETLKLIAREGVTGISGTPAHLISLLAHPEFESTDVSSVKGVGVGGSQCPPQLMADIERIFGVKTGNTYGMGENIIHTRTLPNDSEEDIRNTVGKPVPGAEVGILGDDLTTELPVGEVGEVAYRGPSLFLAYYKNPELTAETRNAAGWFFTGDLGFLDDRGYLHLSGRKKEMINRGGTKIFPKEIEDLLHSHPKILRAAVVGMPDYRLGERICAFVETEGGADVELGELREFLTEQKVMKHKIPERLEIVDALPMTPTGKIKKEPLAQEIAAKLEREGAGAGS